MTQVAFDVAVLMESQSQEVFEEFLAMHAGAKRLCKLWEAKCSCGEAGCFRHGLHELSETVSFDKDLMLAFLDSFNNGFEPLRFEEFEAAFTKLLEAAERKHGIPVHHMMRAVR